MTVKYFNTPHDLVEWLYGREPDGGGDAHAAGNTTVFPVKGGIAIEGFGTLEVDEAIDFARAILSSARQGQEKKKWEEDES